MARPSRVTSVILIAAALGLIGLMAYALLLDSEGSLGPLHAPTRVTEVAVYYPETSSWRSVQAAVHVGEQRGRFRVERSDANSILLVLPRTGRHVRLGWHNSGGTTETCSDLDSALESGAAPQVVVGSSNTALTLTLARTLADHASDGKPSRVLLVPDATAVYVWKAGATENSASRRTLLLDEYPGRSFRICLNNDRLARLLVDFETELRHVRPSAIDLVDDPADPYSVDFSHSLEAAMKPIGVQIERHSLSGLPVGHESESLAADEARWATQVARRAAQASKDAPVWVVLALQGDPARRRIFALEKSIPTEDAEKVRVLCGDGLGLQSLQQLAGRLAFRLLCASSLSPAWNGGSAAGDDAGAQTHYEWLSLLAEVLDQRDEPADLAARFRILRRPDAESSGLVFKDGERAGTGLGCVIEALPLSGRVRAFTAEEGARWRAFVWSGAAWQAGTLELEFDTRSTARSQ